MKTQFKQSLLTLALVAGVCAAGVAPEMAQAAKNYSFRMVPSAGAKTCLAKARGYVTLNSLGSVENMHVEVWGLPPNTEYDFFVTQTPEPPFGLSWYQGDMETDQYGHAVGDFTGRFSKETFIVAIGVDDAPTVDKKDAKSNPTTAPIHTLHLGLWFNSPEDAKKAGCADLPTPFNGEHNAGIQVLNTSQFPKLDGPLGRLR